MHLYVHIRQANGDLAKDLTGTEYESLASAKDDAMQAAREIMADRLRQATPPYDSAIIITNEHGQEVMTVPFSEAIPRQRAEQG